MSRFSVYFGSVALCSALLSGCGQPSGNVSAVNSNIAVNTNVNANAFNANVTAAAAGPTFVEPQTYQGVISLTLQTIGEQQNASMPPLKAIVARSGADRVMEFTLPTNEKVAYMEKGGMKYIVLPTRKQYAELTSEALGFEVRRLMMPEQIVNQLKGIQGVKFAGEETVNGRQIQKYVYGSTANTGTQAGTVATESYFLIDKETNLPIRSEIVSQSTSGGNVQGVKGARLLSEMTDVRPQPDPNLFNIPAEFQKIDPEQVKAQANLLFSAAAAIIGQMVNQANQAATPVATMTPASNTANR
ncbi:MAG: hypothetical protein ABIR33_09360 [Pyrinomonadaceae bacterium]